MSPGAAGRMAKASSIGLERVLPGADFREHLDGRLQVPTRVALGGRDHSRLGAAQERIGRELLGKRGGKRRLAAIATNPDRKSTRLNSSHQIISYAVFCLKKKKK